MSRKVQSLHISSWEWTGRCLTRLMLLHLQHLITKAWQKSMNPSLLLPLWVARMQEFAPIHKQEHQWGLMSKLKGQVNKKHSDQWPSFICESAQMHTGKLKSWTEGELSSVWNVWEHKRIDPVCVLLESVTVFSHCEIFRVFTLPQHDAAGKGFWDSDEQRAHCVRDELCK